MQIIIGEKPPMNIIREFHEASNTCVIRAGDINDPQSRTLMFLENLFDLAVKDFPELEQNAIEIVRYERLCDPNSIGIIFQAPRKPSEAYTRILRLTLTF